MPIRNRKKEFINPTLFFLNPFNRIARNWDEAVAKGKIAVGTEFRGKLVDVPQQRVYNFNSTLFVFIDERTKLPIRVSGRVLRYKRIEEGAEVSCDPHFAEILDAEEI